MLLDGYSQQSARERRKRSDHVINQYYIPKKWNLKGKRM
jgi:hypothetical protein